MHELPNKGLTRSELGEVTLENWRIFPFNKWAFQHVRELIPTAEIESGERVSPLIEAPYPLESIKFNGLQGESWTLAKLLSASETSGFLVIKEDRIIFEQYQDGLKPHQPHLAFSVTKSITGLLTGILAEKGVISLGEKTGFYIPEAKGSCYEDCSVQNLLDMSVDTSFTEAYLDRHADYGRYRESTGWNPSTDPKNPGDLKSFLISMKRGEGFHGETFHYVTPNTDLVGWIVERTSGKTYAELVGDLIWKPMGAQWNAYVTVDRLGAARAGGGVCATLRDLARIGMLMRDQGKVMDQSVISSKWVHDTTSQGDRNAWKKGNYSSFLPNGCYRNFWYQTRNESSAFFAVGIHGQWIYVDPKAQVVIAKFSAQKDPEDDHLDEVLLQAFDIICRTLE